MLIILAATGKLKKVSNKHNNDGHKDNDGHNGNDNDGHNGNDNDKQNICSDTQISIQGSCVSAQVDDNSYRTYHGYKLMLRSGIKFNLEAAEKIFEDNYEYVKQQGGKYWSIDQKFLILQR